MHRRISFSSLLMVLGLITLLASPSFSQETVIVLSDIVGGGDGSGTAPPENTGINPDTGVFETTNIFGNVANTGDALQIVEEEVSEYIDSVFILTEATMPINSEEVTFDFLPTDTSPHTWDFILKDRTNDIDSRRFRRTRSAKTGLSFKTRAVSCWPNSAIPVACSPLKAPKLSWQASCQRISPPVH